MITRRKQNSTNSSWKPFATSTPLKIIPDNTKTDGLPQKQFTGVKDAKAPLQKKIVKTLNNGQGKQIPEQSGQVAKKVKRNRSTFYFHQPSSSSSDDDDDNSCLSSNGPIIKINLEGSTNTKLSLRNGDSKKKIFASPKNSIESNKIIVENGVNDKATENGKPDEVILTQQKSNSEMKTSFRSKNNNYDKQRENSLKEEKIVLQNVDNNSCQNSKKHKGKIVDLNGCESNSSTESSFLDLAPTKALGKSSQQNNVNLKSKKNVNVESQNPFVLKDVLNKRKRTKPMVNSDPEKKRVRNSEELTSVDESPTSRKRSKLKIKGFRKNSSHQLFSDSMHQELINSLDLTTGEPVEPEPEPVFDSPWKLTLRETLQKRTKPQGKAVKNLNFTQMENPKRSTRQRQQPKEFWMPRYQCELHNQATSVSKEKSGNEELLKLNTNQNKTSGTVLESEPTKRDFNQGNSKESLSVKSNSKNGDAVSASQYPDINKVQNEKGHVLKNAEQINADCIKVTTKKVNMMSKTKKLRFTQKCPNKTRDVKKSEKDEYQVEGEDNKENETKTDKVNLNPLATNFPDVFKQLNQLTTFEDYVNGVQTAECWSLKDFKCGVLKVSSQNRISNKTSFYNSYFGGILIKGSLKMKIGSKDLEMNQGDMAFVPPLTEWCIIGTHESESLFYYWCGRFKA